MCSGVQFSDTGVQISASVSNNDRSFEPLVATTRASDPTHAARATSERHVDAR